ncbi:MAG: hypothetical protein M1543_03360 [Firmicutes bacterium]|nr:hypothetical protein [Bacillota bacterium]
MAGISLVININTIRIAEVDTGSAVTIGNNYFYDWHTYNKMNNGFGRLCGDRNSLVDTSFRVDDPDFQDQINYECLADPALRKLID